MATHHTLDTTLDLKNKLHQKTVWPLVQKVAAGEKLDAPFMVELDPTSYCDLACPECVSKDLLNVTRFTHDRLVAIASELVAIGVKAVIFVGGGEPLVHPAIGEVLEICGRGGLKIGLITNGTLIDRHLPVLAQYAEWVRVSVDAASGDTFNQFRPHVSGRNVFDRVIANMRALKSAGVRTLGFSFLLMRRQEGSISTDSNYSEVYEAGKLAKSVGCNYFEIKPVFDPVTHVVCPQPQSLLDDLTHQIERLREIEDSSFKVILAQATLELLNGEFMAELYDYGGCHISELRTLISPTGVYVCPLYRGRASHSFGDPTQQSISEIWNGVRRASFMSGLKPCSDCLPKCSRHLSNIEIDRLAQGGAAGRPVPDFDFFI